MKISNKEIIEEAISSVDESVKSLNILKEKFDSKFVDAVKVITVSKKVFVSGIGKSGLIAKKIAATFTSIGIPSFFLHPVEALHGDIGMVGKGDTAILLSKSGTTDEIARILPYLKNRGIKTIAIVSNIDSFLGKNADIVLDGFVERESCPFNIAPTTSSLVALAIGDALAVCAMKVNNLSVRDFAQNHPLGQIGMNITITVGNVMHKGKALPLISSTASFRNALIEITDKSLGCVCVTDKNGNLKGIITDGDVRRIFHDTDNIHGLKVRDVMTKNPVKITKDIHLGEALSIMENRKTQINVLPVVNTRGKCIGVIRLHDIVKSGL
ncbi:SIS domain-containing protein [Bacteroidota bacterium]